RPLRKGEKRGAKRGGRVKQEKRGWSGAGGGGGGAGGGPPSPGEPHAAPPISYTTTAPNNPVSRLDARLAQGKTKLKHREEFGYLESVLRELDVPVSSQMLVVSKTSLQRRRISPRTPRAIYFNDDVYVGYCHDGEVMEVSVADPKLGTVFYTLEQTKNERPRFSRQTDSCLLCHSNS